MKKETLTQVLSCEICKILKNIYFKEQQNKLDLSFWLEVNGNDLQKDITQSLVSFLCQSSIFLNFLSFWISEIDSQIDFHLLYIFYYAFYDYWSTIRFPQQSETATRDALWKKVENSSVRISFLIKLQASSLQIY